MKSIFRFVAVLTCVVLSISSVRAQYSSVMCSNRPFNARIQQIDYTDSTTIVTMTFYNDGRKFVNVSEDMFIRTDADGKRYYLLNSYNMPISGHDESRHMLLDSPDQEHHFALEFQRVPKGLAMDIVESEGNEQAMNFYDVKCDTTDVVAPVDLGELERLSPVKEYGTYAQDGEVIQYMVYKDVMVSVHMQQTDEYGKYFTVDMDVSNYGSRPVVVDPTKFSASSFFIKKKARKGLNILTAEEYDKKVKRSQAWKTFLVVAAEVAVVAAAAALDAHAAKERDEYYRHHRYAPRRHHYYHHRYSTYRYHHSDYDGFATIATTGIAAVVTAGMVSEDKAKREELQAGYTKLNTVNPGENYTSYFNIKYEKTDNLEVRIGVNGCDYPFSFEWQDKKK